VSSYKVSKSLFYKKANDISSLIGKILGERHLFYTILTEVFVMFAGLATLRLASSGFGAVGFGEYSVAKRAMTIITFPLLFGLGISVPRYIGVASAFKDERRTLISACFWASSLILLCSLLCFALVVWMMPGKLSQLFFGNSSLSALMFSTSVGVVGLGLHTLAYSYYRGCFNFSEANLLQLINLAVIPVSVFWLVADSVSSVILINGMGWIGIAGIFIARFYFQNISSPDGLAKEYVVKLTAFGLPRIPGEFALFGLFSIPIFFIANRHGIEQAGVFSLGFSLIQLVSSIFAVIGGYLLPKISRMAAESRWADIKKIVRLNIIFTILASVAFCLLEEFFLKELVELLSNHTLLDYLPSLRLLLLGSAPYAIYITIRSPLDALSVVPHNSANLIFTLIVLLIGFWATASDLSAAIIIIISLSVLAVLSVIQCIKVLRNKVTELPHNFIQR
jgi:O-antigen/teichoic acid export membrane protein